MIGAMIAAHVEVYIQLKDEVGSFSPPHYVSNDPVITITIVCGVVAVVIVLAVVTTIITAIKLILRSRQTTEL